MGPVSLSLGRRETIGIVGESGSGKTSLARAIVGLVKPAAGSVSFEGRTVHGTCKGVQLLFQDPQGSFNPRRTIRDSLEEPLAVQETFGRRLRRQKQGTRVTIEAALSAVGLSAEQLDRYPHQLSGGQRQRAALARALILRPRVVVLDEPTSALDLSVQAQVLNLLVDMQREFDLAYLLISHNIAVVRHLSDRVMVMKSGQVVEGPSNTVLASPQHEYTKALLAASSLMQ
jgi:ABC-type glutathione transport system ATPase component